MSAPKIADVVCAQKFFRRKGTKPILQVTVSPRTGIPSRTGSVRAELELVKFDGDEKKGMKFG
jgi:hypothetical protein